jgi:ATP synthase protein I
MKSIKKISYIDRTGKIKEHTQEVKEREEISKMKLAEYANVGYYLLIPILLGVFGGVYLDSVFKTKPILTILGILFGFISSIYNLVKFVRNENTGNKH